MSESIAVLEVHVATMQKTVEELAHLARGQSDVNHNLQLSIGLLQAAQVEAKHRAETDSKRIDAHDAKWNQVRGGWFSMTIIATILCGLASILGAWVHGKISH